MYEIFSKILGQDIQIHNLQKDIPFRYEKIGDALIFNGNYLNNTFWKSRDDLKEIFSELCVIFKVNKIFKGKNILLNDYRTPTINLIYGNDTIVNHIENGVNYRFDLTKNMFSSGNVNERIRMGKLNRPNEVVVDLYAGIGYFTLPILKNKNSMVALVHACDWNPDAIKYLRQNLVLNHIAPDRCKIYEGDNREKMLHDFAGSKSQNVLTSKLAEPVVKRWKICPLGVADRVILGLIPSSSKSWLTAFKALKFDDEPTKPLYLRDKIMNVHMNCDFLALGNDIFRNFVSRRGDRFDEKNNDDSRISRNFDNKSETGVHLIYPSRDFLLAFILRKFLVDLKKGPISGTGGDHELTTDADDLLDISQTSIFRLLSSNTTRNGDIVIDEISLDDSKKMFFRDCWVHSELDRKHLSLVSSEEFVDLMSSDSSEDFGSKIKRLPGLNKRWNTFLRYLWLLTVMSSLHSHLLEALDFHRLADYKEVKLILQDLNKVKSYGPKIIHYVLDVVVRFTFEKNS